MNKLNNTYNLKQIGIIRTPYENSAPYQPLQNDENEFILILDEKYKDGLKELDKFSFIYIIYYMHKIKKEPKMLITPPWAENKTVGLFASRSPVRPNPIGISIVEIKKIIDNKIYTSGLDAFNNTPLLDIKPYINDLDKKSNAGYGWILDTNNEEHLNLHIKGIPHNH